MLMFLKHFFINNWITITSLVSLIIVASSHKNLKKETGVIFVLAASSCLVCTLFSGLDLYFGRSEFTTTHIMRVIGSIFSYAYKPLTSLYILYFVMQPKTKKSKWTFWLLTIPAIINFIICMFSFAWGKYLVCYFTPDNHWSPGYLSKLPTIIGYCYLVLIVGICIYRAIKRDFEEIFAVMFLCVITFITTLFELEIGNNSGMTFEFSLLNGTSSVGLMFIYLHLYITTNNIDQLTGLKNRGAFFNDFEKYKNRITAIISIDMNGLKETNDTQGHHAGDAALAETGLSIKSFIKDSIGYRVGGDEFIVLCYTTKEEDVINILDNIRKDIEKKGLSIAGGYCMVGGDKGLFVNDAMRMADFLMYKNKKEIKESKASMN